MSIDEKTRKIFQAWGAQGGKSKSEAKRKAVLENLKKANAARLLNKKKKDENKTLDR